MNYKVLVRKGEDGWYVVSVPSLPGCHSQGKTIEEALVNIEEAIKVYIAVCKKFGEAIVEDDTEVIEAVVKVRLDKKSAMSYSFAA